MNSACREKLRGLSLADGEHAGLVRDRYLRAHKEKEPTPEEALLEALRSRQASPAYAAAFARWRALGERAGWLVLEAVAVSPVAIGLGNESPLEAGLTIHHTYGMPLIPGSAIKGLCRRTAEGQALSKEQRAALHGDSGAAGGTVYFDAWYDPGSPESAKGKPFHRDVVTVHHPGYYRTRGKEWPTDFDDPTPLPFLVVRPGARFVFAVECPSEAWHGFVREALAYGLRELGIGAKTNAGYGVFTVEPPIAQAPPGHPPPPREVVWEGCRLKQRVVKGVVEILVESAQGNLTIIQRDGDPVRANLTPEQREGLKKGGLRASLVVRLEGSAARFVRVERWMEEG